MKILLTGKRSFFCKHFINFDKKNKNIFFLKRLKSNYYLEKDFNKSERISIVHASGTSSVINSQNNPSFDFDKNFLSTLSLINFISNKNYKIDKLIYLSTASVCGEKKNWIKETDEYNPKSIYSFHKMYSEIFLRDFCKKNKINLVILRIFSLYGEGKKNQFFWDLLNKLKKDGSKITLFGSGKEIRDYLYIKDAVKIVFSLIYNKNLPQEYILNLASGSPKSIKEIVKFFSKNTTFLFSNEFNSLFPNKMISDNSKLNKFKDFEFTKFEIGAKKYQNWFNKQ